VIVAEGDFVIVHSRFSGTGLPRNWIAADIVRIGDGVLVEHWDVLQDEAARADSKSGLPMFGDSFAEHLDGDGAEQRENIDAVRFRRLNGLRGGHVQLRLLTVGKSGILIGG
jgi:hypothetical protein